MVEAATIEKEMIELLYYYDPRNYTGSTNEIKDGKCVVNQFALGNQVHLLECGKSVLRRNTHTQSCY